MRNVIAEQAIYEGMSLLGELARSDPRWLQSSIPLQELNRLAQELGYRDAAQIVHNIVLDREADSEMFSGVYNCEEW